jgi:hypothetical protein
MAKLLIDKIEDLETEGGHNVVVNGIELCGYGVVSGYEVDSNGECILNSIGESISICWDENGNPENRSNDYKLSKESLGILGEAIDSAIKLRMITNDSFGDELKKKLNIH